MRAYLEITNRCNLTCSFCPGTHRKGLFVSPDIIRQRLSKLSGITELYLHLMGEPLLHPDFAEIADICQARGIPVNLTTNGTLLDTGKQDILRSHSIFRQINFSLQALTKQDTGILNTILAFCQRMLAERPELYLNLRLWNLEKDYSVPDSNEFLLSAIFQKLNISRPAVLPFNRHWHSLNLTGRLYLHVNPIFEWPVQANGNDSGKAFCHGMTSQIGILADGTVVPCCLDSEGIIALGNLDQQSLAEILHSKRAEGIRSGFRQGIAAEELCKKCTFRQILNQ